MRIKAIDLVLPPRLVTNDDVVDLVRFHSRKAFRGDLRKFGDLALRHLRGMQADCRFWSDKATKPLQCIADAATNAISKSGLTKNDIDIVIYTGVDRGFYEPANAYFLADFLGIRSAECFDIVDACNGWSRALQLCNGLFHAGSHKVALVLNGEFPLFEGGPINPRLFRFEDSGQLEHRLPAFALGEGATATILTAEEDRNWDYTTLSLPEYADLCTISCHDAERFSKPSGRLDVNGPGQFSSYAQDMIKYGSEHSKEIFNRLRIPRDEIKVVLPHTVSPRAVAPIARELQIHSKVFYIFPSLGNLISASIPAGLARVVQSGQLERGDVVAAWVGSAGMVFSAYTFTNYIEA